MIHNMLSVKLALPKQSNLFFFSPKMFYIAISMAVICITESY